MRKYEVRNMTKAKRKRLIYNLVTYALVIAAYIILQNMIGAKTISRSLKGLLVLRCGLHLGSLRGKIFLPDHAWCVSAAPPAQRPE